MKTANNQQKTRILFANFPADGHFNPLTGLAKHLKDAGYDVRWYTSNSYAPKLKKMGIPHYRFKQAMDISDGNFDKIFPGRAAKKSQIGKLKFDIVNAFILRAPEYYADIKELYKEFTFDLMIADCAFTAIPFVRELMQVPVLSIGVMPLTETSRDLPPAGLGLEPSYTFTGKLKQAVLRAFADRIIFKGPNKVLHKLLEKFGIPHAGESVFDTVIRHSNLLLQSGTPGFEYYRSDMSSNIRFVGPLLPYGSHKDAATWFDERLNKYENVILVTQGTVEKDVNKLLVPSLDAFKDAKDTLVVCTTGGSQTAALKAKYPQENVIIEDFIPFNDVMPYADAYITNGGYGGVLLGIENKLPLIVAGVHEGKNEICARVGYFKLGINLKTEKPSATQIKTAVEKLLADNTYKQNVEKLAREFSYFNPNELTERYIKEILKKNGTLKTIRISATAKIY